MTAKEIRITCKGSKTLPYGSFENFQGELKHLTEENYKRLRKQILELGFSAPVFVWEHDGINYILDGHQRIRTVSNMVTDEGYTCPPLPVAEVQAKSLKEAKKKVLAISSQYGTMSFDGLQQFIDEAGMEWEHVNADFRFPEINIDHFLSKDDVSMVESEDYGQAKDTKFTVMVSVESARDRDRVVKVLQELGLSPKIKAWADG
jgi:ParB-like chromosome segregation protein Spo0J